MTDRSLVVGLTGGIGSGKSAAMKFFSDLAVPCIDADDVARTVVDPGQPALQTITQRYGQHLLTSSGELERRTLRQIVFADAAEKQWLENLLHPLISAKISAWLDLDHQPYAILCSPLLLETSQYELVDRILLIDIPEDLQMVRTTKRDQNTPEQVSKIIASQMPRTLKQQKADDIIVNDKDLRHLEVEVGFMHHKYTLLAQSHAKKA